MKLAPALTWLHLFPADTVLHGQGLPDWFQGLVGTPREGGQPIRVLFGADAAAVADAARHGGVVVCDGQGLNEAVFKNLGFRYVRRFAAVPNLAEARWFVPLGNRAATAAGFDLFSPAKFTARLKLAAVRIAARFGIGGWYKDDVWIATQEEPPLEAMLRRVLPVPDFRLALSAGAPEPARNRKASAAVIDTFGKTRAFVKLPTSPLAHTLVRREAEMLTTLNAHFAGQECHVPGVSYAGEYDGRYALVQTPLLGKSIAPKLTPQHMAFLEALTVRTDRRRAAESPFFRELVARVDGCGENGTDLRKIIDAITPTLAEADVPRTIIHGDFAPWNIRLEPGAKCINVFDWEYGVTDGLPLIDETHFNVQVGYLLNDWTPEIAASHMQAAAKADTQYGPKVTAALQAVYLMDSVARLLEEGYSPADEMIVWYRRALDLITAPRGERKLAHA